MQNVEELEARAKLAEADLLEEQANLLNLAEELEGLETERAGVSVRKAGSKTEAVKRLESLDERQAKLRRDIALSEAAVSELEQDLAAAEDRLAEAESQEEEAHVAELAQELEQAKLRVEDALSELVAALKALQAANREHSEATGTDGFRLQERVRQRVSARLRAWLGGPATGAAAPPLAERESDAATSANGGSGGATP
jgi:chromosome segregation ATPase